MKAIDVLVGADRLDDLRPVDVIWQWQLDEDAVDVVVGVELVDEVEKLRLARARGEVVRARDEADFLAGEALVAHVDARRVVVADEDDGEPGRAQACADALAHPLLHFAAYLRGDGAAVDDLCGHV
jgi:hypothetical protein